MRNKSINRDKLHQEFEELLKNLKPDERLIQLFQQNLDKQIQESEKDKDLIVTEFKNSLAVTENKIQRYTERIGKTEDEDLIQNYESELKKLYQEKVQILDKIEDEKNWV
jgi:pyruvate/2-oxoacid:ferredoxin oxidoreductase alpha subunit